MLLNDILNIGETVNRVLQKELLTIYKAYLFKGQFPCLQGVRETNFLMNVKL